MRTEAMLLQTKLQTDMDTYMLDHNLQLQSTLTELKQKLRTEFFLDLQLEKSRIKDELVNDRTEMAQTKSTDEDKI